MPQPPSWPAKRNGGDPSPANHNQGNWLSFLDQVRGYPVSYPAMRPSDPIHTTVPLGPDRVSAGTGAETPGRLFAEGTKVEVPSCSHLLRGNSRVRSSVAAALVCPPSNVIEVSRASKQAQKPAEKVREMHSNPLPPHLAARGSPMLRRKN
ncbi:uncharacterized protein LY79DRAFT_382459 [Colletotrichum navitas]|uniref:Uncharacterized protein n=1 Tax=Colletotrichum navitas TaxID=681940 RepID=A0AAD8V7P5_9PEZI|nr:uncharacterized protein LY79DRAFT_382459 [Colletotrichum navitas]KAK1597347.1 hypothetical protein LY79DRAFT_382459 [Colletotrichum navitas]